MRQRLQSVNLARVARFTERRLFSLYTWRLAREALLRPRRWRVVEVPRFRPFLYRPFAKSDQGTKPCGAQKGFSRQRFMLRKANNRGKVADPHGPHDRYNW